MSLPELRTGPRPGRFFPSVPSFHWLAAISLCLLTGMLVLSSAPAVAQGTAGVQAGVAAAVRGDVRLVALAATSSGDDAVGRVISSGDRIFLGDKVETGPGAGLQIMLMDETIFTIGPNAEMVVDKFVYDPTTDAGEVTASIVKGAFRFVSGRIAKRNPSDMNVRLPVATIGIRGTSVAGEVIPATLDAPPSAEVILLGPGADNNADERAGRVIVDNAGSSVEISRPGFGTTIAGTQTPPTPPVRVPPTRIAALGGNLAGTGGAGENGSGDSGGDGQSSADGQGDDGQADDGGDTAGDDGNQQGGSEAAPQAEGDDGTADGGDDGNGAGTQQADNGGAQEQSGTNSENSGSQTASSQGGSTTGGGQGSGGVSAGGAETANASQGSGNQPGTGPAAVSSVSGPGGSGSTFASGGTAVPGSAGGGTGTGSVGGGTSTVGSGFSVGAVSGNTNVEVPPSVISPDPVNPGVSAEPASLNNAAAQQAQSVADQLSAVTTFQQLTNGLDSGTGTYTMTNVPLVRQTSPTFNGVPLTASGHYDATVNADFGNRTLELIVDNVSYDYQTVVYGGIVDQYNNSFDFNSENQNLTGVFDDQGYSNQVGNVERTWRSDEPGTNFNTPGPNPSVQVNHIVEVTGQLRNSPELGSPGGIATSAAVNVKITLEHSGGGETIMSGGSTAPRN